MVLVGLEQFLIMLADVLRHAELHLWDIVPLAVLDIRVDGAANMQHHVVVVRVAVVAVLIPVGGAVVNLDIAHPQCAVNLHFGVEEVRSGVVVMQSRVNNLYSSAVGSRQLRQWQESVLPSVV